MANQDNNININDLFNDPNGIYEDHSFESIVNGNEMNYEDDLFTENRQIDEMEPQQPNQLDSRFDNLNTNIASRYNDADVTIPRQSNPFEESPTNNVYQPHPYPDPRIGFTEQQLDDKKQAFIERLGITQRMFNYLDDNIKQENPNNFLNYMSSYGQQKDDGVLTYSVYHPDYGDIRKQTEGKSVTDDNPYETYPKGYLDEKRQAFMKRMNMNEDDMQHHNEQLSEQGAMVDYLSDEGGVSSHGSELPIYTGQKHLIDRQFFNTNTIGPNTPPPPGGGAMAMATADADVNINQPRGNRQTQNGNGNANQQRDNRQTQNGNANQLSNARDRAKKLAEMGAINNLHQDKPEQNTNSRFTQKLAEMGAINNANQQRDNRQTQNGNANQLSNARDRAKKLAEKGAINNLHQDKPEQNTNSRFTQKLAEMGAIDENQNARHHKDMDAINDDAIHKSINQNTNTQSNGNSNVQTNSQSNMFESPKPKSNQTTTNMFGKGLDDLQTKQQTRQTRTQTTTQTNNLFGNGLDDLQNSQSMQQRH